MEKDKKPELNEEIFILLRDLDCSPCALYLFKRILHRKLTSLEAKLQRETFE